MRQRPGEQAPLARREPGELDTDPAAIDPVVAQGGRERVGRRRPSVVLQRTGERTGRSAPVGEVEVRAPERVDRGGEPGSTRGEETVHGQDRAPGAENRRTETRERGADASARAQHELLRLDLEAILVAAEVGDVHRRGRDDRVEPGGAHQVGGASSIEEHAHWPQVIR